MQNPEAIAATIQRFPDTRILVVGDMMLDQFIWGKVTRISPEAPVPVVQVTRESAHLGGAANVVCNIAALGGKAVPVGLVGTDAAGEKIIELLRGQGISVEGIVTSRDYFSIQKTRIIAHHQQVCRVDREGATHLSDRDRMALRERLLGLMASGDGLIISDYGKGVVEPELLSALQPWHGRVLISVDPKDRNFEFYRNVDILTPNQAEAERISGVTIAGEGDLRRAAAAIFAKLSCRKLLITLGEQGMALFDGPGEMVLIPTRAREVFDVSGAGDTVIATYTLAHAAGASARLAAILANAAAGVVVAKLGTATLTSAELLDAVAHP